MHSVIQPVFRLGGLRPSHLLAIFGLMLCLVANSAPLVRAQSALKLHRKVIVMHDPEYPAVLKNGHFEGQVKIDATVLPNGTVSKVEVKGGNPILAQYASAGRDEMEIRPIFSTDDRRSDLQFQSQQPVIPGPALAEPRRITDFCPLA